MARGATKFWFYVARVPNEVPMVMPCNAALMIVPVTDAPIQFDQTILLDKQTTVSAALDGTWD